MDQTPTRISRHRSADIEVLDQENQSAGDQAKHGRVRKPPPVTPRRFNKFFTPRPRNASQAVKTSRNALRTISSSALNTRRRPALQANTPNDYLPANENQVSRKKRRFSQISSTLPTPPSRSVNFLPSSQEPLTSSPIKYGRESLERDVVDSDDEYASTDIDEDAWLADDYKSVTGPKITQYSRIGTSSSLLAHRLGSRRSIRFAEPSNVWQAESANFYSSPDDINTDLRAGLPNVIPFSMAACRTNPIVAAGDEEGVIRFLDTAESSKDSQGFQKTVLTLQPHDNALMDLCFSSDDTYIATASGDQTCQVIDVQAHRSLYSLRAHTASVKKIQFQPGSGDKILASCGRDGSICLWDLRLKGQPVNGGRRARVHVTEMAENLSVLAPVLEIYDAHSTNSKGNSSGKRKTNHIPGRNDFSITSLTFLDSTRSNLLATASEVDTVIKLWDLRSSQLSARKRGHSQIPVSLTEEPRSHERHRRFGINSLALSTDSSRIFALARDHTVYAYSTSHLVLGSGPELIPSTRLTRKSMAPMRSESDTGIGPIYALRHPSLRVATFWPRLSIRPATDKNPEMLAVASTDDCVVLFPTSERYHNSSTRSIPILHDPNVASQQSDSAGANTLLDPENSSPAGRPHLQRRATSSFTSLFTKSRNEEDGLPVYCHGTPLINGHNKEVTSVAWSSEGHLVTASDDFTMRCWREDANEARRLRSIRQDAVALHQRGWASVGVEGWDDEY